MMTTGEMSVVASLGIAPSMFSSIESYNAVSKIVLEQQDTIHSIQRTHRNLQDSWELKSNRVAELEGDIIPHFANLPIDIPVKDLTNEQLRELLGQLKTYPYAYGDSALRSILSEILNRQMI